MTVAQELERIQVSDPDTDGPENLAHIVPLPKHLRGLSTPQAYVMTARVEGFAITALCGYTWIPQNDPKARPVCAKCKAIYEHDPNGFGDRGELPDA